MKKEEKASTDQPRSLFMTNYMKFLGGTNLLFTLFIIILLGIVIIIFDKISYVFTPIVVLISTIVTPLLIALILYYLLRPIVSFLEKFKIKRLPAVLIVIGSLIALATSLILWVTPMLFEQSEVFVFSFPIYLKRLGNSIQEYFQHSRLFRQYYDDILIWLQHNIPNFTHIVSNSLGGAYQSILNIVGLIKDFAVVIMTFPFVLFFILKDREKFQMYTLSFLPPKYRKKMTEIIIKMDTQVGSYIQGQILVSLCIGILLFIGYSIIDLPYALPLAMLASIMSVVPYLGPAIAISPALIVSLGVGGWFLFFKLIIVWGVVQFLEGNFISPNIMGKTLSVHPLTIIMVLLVSGNLFGVIGVVLGIPGYAVLKVLLSELFDTFKFRYNKYFGEEDNFYEFESNDNKHRE